MKNFARNFVATVLCTFPAFGQTLNVSSAAGAPGESLTVEISLRVSAGKAPVVLQWETIFPAQLLELAAGGPVISQTAKAAGKTITCSAPRPYSRVCILAGGQEPIADGTIAILQFKVVGKPSGGTTSIQIRRAESLTANLTRSHLDDAAGRITIR